MPYLMDAKGFSSAQVEADILPVSVYASLVFFLLAGPAASATSTKAVLVTGGACKLLTRVLLLWGRTLGAMRLMQVAFAAGAASDLMLYAYLAELAPRDAHLDGVRDAPASISGEGAAVAPPAPLSPDAQPLGSQVRFATGAASAAALLGYMLAAELGQIAFERGASYESLFSASLIAVALGCVGVATLPGRRKRASLNAETARATRANAARSCDAERERDAGEVPPAVFGVPNASRSTTRTKKTSRRERVADAVVAACASCYGSSAAIALSAWWVLGTPPASALETYVLSLLNDIEAGTTPNGEKNDAGGHVVFFARAASAAAALAAARAHPKVAAAPETYATASAATAACAAVLSAATSVVTASVAYTLAVACVHGVSVLAYAQTATCAAAARRATLSSRAGYAEMEDAADDADDATVVAAKEEGGAGGDSEGLLFGLNGAFALAVLVLAQASVDATRGGARGAAAAAAALAALAAGSVVAIAAARRVASGADWALAPTLSDVSYSWLRRLLASE